MTAKWRVLPADDHNVVRAGLRALIDAQADMEVVTEAADGEAACRLAVELGPDVAVMDVSMPRLGGASATERIKRDRPEVKVLALTVHEDCGYLQQLIQAGASGYLLKRVAADDLIHAIRVVARGDTYLDPSLTGKVLGSLMGRSARAGSTPGDRLSDREEEVLWLIARGFTNQKIAAHLDVSVQTVATHKARAMEKLGVESRASIGAYAIRSGWVRAPSLSRSHGSPSWRAVGVSSPIFADRNPRTEGRLSEIYSRIREHHGQGRSPRKTACSDRPRPHGRPSHGSASPP